MVQVLLVFCCRVTLMPRCSFLVRAPTLLQAKVLEYVQKPIYHSQTRVTEASHNMPEGAETAGLYKALRLLFPSTLKWATFCSPNRAQSNPISWWFCHLCSNSGVPLKKWQLFQHLPELAKTGTSQISCFSHCHTGEKPYGKSKGKSMFQE